MGPRFEATKGFIGVVGIRNEAKVGPHVRAVETEVVEDCRAKPW